VSAPTVSLLPGECHLICPALFVAPPGAADLKIRAPALDRLLARADHVEAPSRDPLETLAAAFGLTAAASSTARVRLAGGMPQRSVGDDQSPAMTGALNQAPPVTGPDRDLPSAALSLLADAPERARDGCWFHADPVHLRPDRDRLLLFAGPALAPRVDEADALVAAFNAHFAADGLYLIAVRPDRWYLRVAEQPNLRTCPLYEVVGRDLDACLPNGPDARAWNRWQNEAQMLFYRHPVNQMREAAGRPVISGVWTWGGGVLPTVSGGPALTIADHPLAVGLARASGGAWRGLDALDCAAWRDATGTVLFWDHLWQSVPAGDLDAWRRGLDALDVLVATLLSELAAKRLRRLTIDNGIGDRFTLSRAAQRSFWRRRGTLGDWIVRRSGPDRRP
jgi:hypothetical protein